MPSFVRRRYFVTFVALCGLFATWGAMLAFDWSAKLGTVAFGPWVALIGFDAGMVGGVTAAAAALGGWVIASNLQNGSYGSFQLGVRSTALVMLGVLSALAGLRLRSQERELRGTATMQSALIDATLDGICLTDREGEILIINKPLRRLAIELGLPLSGTVPERLLAIADKMTEPARYRARMLALAETPGDASIDEFEVAGTGRVFRGYTSPVADGRIWTLREVTADRELDRMRDAFVATVSHELRTPLTSISGFLEMMEDEEHELGDAGRQYLDVIRRATERLHSLVEDLLLVAQIEARRIELELAPVDLVELASGAVQSAQPAAAEKGVALDLVADHPPAVLGDAKRLSQVIDNLVSNAVKFTPDGGHVTVTVEPNRLVVADSGIGVAADEQKQVFSRFFRATTATQRAIPGTGLGLAICHALVEQHGGSIEFLSEEGEGTQVVVSLPSA
ncbi:MAG TPA: ATP-binding protein [Gaiellaceae bacterium]